MGQPKTVAVGPIVIWPLLPVVDPNQEASSQGLLDLPDRLVAPSHCLVVPTAIMDNGRVTKGSYPLVNQEAPTSHLFSFGVDVESRQFSQHNRQFNITHERFPVTSYICTQHLVYITHPLRSL
jgi:hypothetical protein